MGFALPMVGEKTQMRPGACPERAQRVERAPVGSLNVERRNPGWGAGAQGLLNRPAWLSLKTREHLILSDAKVQNHASHSRAEAADPLRGEARKDLETAIFNPFRSD